MIRPNTPSTTKPGVHMFNGFPEIFPEKSDLAVGFRRGVNGLARGNQALSVVVKYANRAQTQHLGDGYGDLPILGIHLPIQAFFVLKIVSGAISTKHELETSCRI